ncbi:MAG: hypothetical protein FJX45_19510 [Alphaproteobacteria bacterium]|nr:hypothetical protein [Alphaproteobacteria bacterium]MBM3654190.1 hypothetical protein [Alphaproteobacteria bacterium]
MTTFDVARRISVLISFLKQELQPPGRSKLSDTKLAALLNAAQADSAFRFTPSNVNQLLHMRMLENEKRVAAVLAALQAVIDTHTSHRIDVQTELPAWVERRGALKLREALRTAPSDPLLEGEVLAERETHFTGAWVFFVVRLSSRDNSKEVIDTSVLVLRPASATQMSLTMITSRWMFTGVAYVLGGHVYLQLRENEGRMGASFIMHVPQKGGRRFSGIGVSRELAEDVPTPPVFGCVCAAERMQHQYYEDKNVTAALARVHELGDRAETADLIAVRNALCHAEIQPASVHMRYPVIFDYLKRHRINGKPGVPTPFLNMAFP